MWTGRVVGKGLCSGPEEAGEAGVVREWDDDHDEEEGVGKAPLTTVNGVPYYGGGVGNRFK